MTDKLEAWIIAELTKGKDPAAVASLVSHISNERVSTIEIEALANHPTIALCKRLLTEKAKSDAILDLYDSLWKTSDDSRRVPVKTRLAGKDFYERFFRTNRPVVIKGLLSNARRLQEWSPESIVARFGSAEIEFMTERDSDPDYDRRFEQHLETSTLSEFLERVRRKGRTNDLYLVGRNNAFQNKDLFPLLNEFKLPNTYLRGCDWRSESRLWLGPSGTITPLHYDRVNILLLQIIGRKRIKLIPPFESKYVGNTSGVYSEVDPSHPDLDAFPEFKNARILNVTLNPGDIIFLPIAWWHWVESLDVSMSISTRLIHTRQSQSAPSRWHI